MTKTIKPLFDPKPQNDFVQQQLASNPFVTSTVANGVKSGEIAIVASGTGVGKSIFSPVSPKQLADAGVSSQRVINLLATFDSPTGILEYGQEVMTTIADKSDKFLAEVKDADVEYVEKQLSGIITLAKSMHLNKKDKSGGLSLSGLVSKVKEHFIDAKEQMMAEFNDVSTQMDRVVNEVDSANQRIIGKLKGLQELYRDNLDDYKKLEVLIKDAEEVFAVKSKELDVKRAQATDALSAEEVNQMSRIMDRLDKKIHNLKKFQLMAVQNAPSIAQMEDSAVTLLEKFHDIKTMTIPLWKKQMRLYIDSVELQRGAKLAASVDDANNSLIRANSQTVSENAITTAQLNQRSIIDDETAEAVHQNLINTLDAVLTINKEGREKRVESANRMDEMKRMYAAIASGQASPSDLKKVN